jgi:hypothetical protein
MKLHRWVKQTHRTRECVSKQSNGSSDIYLESSDRVQVMGTSSQYGQYLYEVIMHKVTTQALACVFCPSNPPCDLGLVSIDRINVIRSTAQCGQRLYQSFLYSIH